MARSAAGTEKSVEIPIEALPRVYWAVVATSKSPEQDWHEHCGERLAGECLQCGMKVSGEELRQLATMDLEKAAEDPKLDRLRLKYCARNSCESRFYRVGIEPDSELHWTSIKEQLAHATPEVRETKPRVEMPKFKLDLSGNRGLFLAGFFVAAVITFFVIRHWVFGYRIPLIQEKHEYRVVQPPPM